MASRTQRRRRRPDVKRIARAIESLERRVFMDATYHNLSGSNFSQDWSNTSQISADDNWSGVPSIIGYFSGNSTSASSTDPSAVTADFATSPDVNANQTNPLGFFTGGVTEFELANPVVAIFGSNSADSPYLVFHVNSTGVTSGVNVSYNVRDIEAGADNAVQKIQLQYRTSTSGPWINVANGPGASNAVIPDATVVGTDTTVTAVNVTLPADANNQPNLQIRVITGNAAGNDEAVGIDDIVIKPAVTAAPGELQIGTAFVRVDENGTNVVIPVSRNNGSAGTVGATFTTTNGTALSGQDFGTSGNSAAYTSTVSFGPGQTSADIVIPLLNDTDDELLESFTVTLSNPTGGATLVGTTTSTASIVDDDGHKLAVSDFTQDWTDTSLIGVDDSWDGVFNIVGYRGDGLAATAGADPSQIADFAGPGGPVVDVEANELDPTTFSGGGVIEFEIENPTAALNGSGTAAAPFLLFDVDTTGVNSVDVSFDIRDLDASIDDALQQVAVQYRIGNSGGFTTVAYLEDVTVPNATQTTPFSLTLTEVANAGLVQFRVITTNAAGNDEAVGIDNIVIRQTPTGLPAWLAPGSAATWDAGTSTLNVTGAATIIADPGVDAPIINATGAAAVLTINPASDLQIHVGGLNLTGGATATVTSLGGARTATNHRVLVVPGSALSIDGTSQLDLTDNDLIVKNGNALTVEGLTFASRNVGGGGSWDGTSGITSSAAADQFTANGLETTALGVLRNGDNINGSVASFAGVSVTDDDVLVKYTYAGDFTLDGQVNGDDEGILGLFYDAGASTGHHWFDGDVTGNGTVDADDEGLFGLLFGNGTAGSAFNQL